MCCLWGVVLLHHVAPHTNILEQHPNIAPIVSCTDGEMVKFVQGGSKEIEILQYLVGLPSESNHIVHPSVSVTGGSIVAMPVA